jgi:hypothetical protein
MARFGLALVTSTLACFALTAGPRGFEGRVDWPSRIGSDILANRRTSAAATLSSERAESADTFVDTIGVNIHLGYLDTVYGSGFSTIILPMLQRSGIRHVRDGGTVLDDPQWMRVVYDRANQLATTLGRRIGFTVVMNPMKGSCDMTHSPVAALLQYLSVANIDALEGPNERDINPPCTDTGLSNQWAIEASTFQRALFETAAASPVTRHIPIVGPSLGAGTWSTSARVIGDQSAFVTYGNQHSYPGGSYPSKDVTNSLTALTPVFGTKRHYATETGYHNMTTYEPRLQQGVSELASGKYMSRLFFEYFNHGLVRTYVHEFIDEAGMPGSEAHYGLLRASGTAKPQFTAIQNTIDILQEPGVNFVPGSLRYSLGAIPDSVHHTLLQKSTGTFYLVLWQEVTSYRIATAAAQGADIPIPPVDVTLTLESPAAQIHQYNPLGSTTAFRSVSNVQTMLLAVLDQALIVEIKP